MLLSAVRPAEAEQAVPDDMVLVPGGTFAMGSGEFYSEEEPVRHVTVATYEIDRHPVTQRQFAEFVDACGYITVAERPLLPENYPGVAPHQLNPGSLVFAIDPANPRPRSVADWWDFRHGASWRDPKGPGSSEDSFADHPVTHIAYEDAVAYAVWAGKTLPTEAQWEFAARGGLEGAVYAWGDEFAPGGRAMANTWPGRFPVPGPDGPNWTSPVGRYPANGYGLQDMIGNVWEWTSDWYGGRRRKDGATSCCAVADRGGASMEESYDAAQPDILVPRKVLKGGSFLCSPDYCRRYRPAARQPQMVDTSSCHIGFRCVAPAGRTAHVATS